MKQEVKRVELRELVASDGMAIYRVDDEERKNPMTVVYLGVNDSPGNYVEEPLPGEGRDEKDTP
ncbi:MAG: hypothetical protein LBP56_07720 [Odoribacteraceae bacterium]|jgi:hypothetical protein|nr:hypothetical protein [Odoribacteraceae bacterium]